MCIHPQSVVHSGVYFADGSLMAQLGTPDMRLPIAYAMHYPKRLPLQGKKLDMFAMGSLTFEKPDEQRFPSLRMAKESLVAGGATGCVLNAANEVAVAHLLQVQAGKPMCIGRIYECVDSALQALGHLSANTLDEVVEADQKARAHVRQLLEK